MYKKINIVTEGRVHNTTGAHVILNFHIIVENLEIHKKNIKFS